MRLVVGGNIPARADEGQGDFLKIRATVERELTNARDAVRDGDARQIGALVECFLANAGHRISVRGLGGNDYVGIGEGCHTRYGRVLWES